MPSNGPDLGRQTKIETIGRYRFCLALENSIATDYVTEKIFDPLFAGTVPIYLGAPNVQDFVPANSYIDAASFGTPADLASYLNHLVETPQAYEAYLAWHSKPVARNLWPGVCSSSKCPRSAVWRRLCTSAWKAGMARHQVDPFCPLGTSPS